MFREPLHKLRRDSSGSNDVKCGLGGDAFTVTVNDLDGPGHLLMLLIIFTVIVSMIVSVPVFFAMNGRIFPFPFVPKPMFSLPVQVNDESRVGLVK
jgi:hypothetical protein